MNRQAKMIVAGLAAGLLVLAVALGFSLTRDAGDSDHGMIGASRNDSYTGMMQAMGRMDSDQMLSQMRAILGEDGYKRMVEHMAEHRNGMQSMYDNSAGGMMHQMMDGMMQRMPDDKNHTMPMMSH